MVNDSAGTDVILTDKSQRPAGAAGFKAAVAIEAERGLCNKPVFITSTDDFVKVFGNPSFDKYGQANLEAYFLAQNNVPLVITRAKNPSLEPTDAAFGCMKIKVQDVDPETGVGSLFIDPNASSNAIATPADDNTCLLFFKGEGKYPCKVLGTDGSDRSNIVIRFSKPATQSAYANVKRTFQLQVFDFAGARHIDKDTDGILGITPNLEQVLDNPSSGEAEDKLALPGYELEFDSGSSGGESSGKKNLVTVFVNGRKGTAPYNGGSVYAAIEAAVLDAKDAKGNPVLTSFKSLGDGTFKVDKGTFNCFDLSISISISASAQGVPVEGVARTAYFNYGCGSVSVTPDNEGEMATVDFAISTGLYLENRKDYMYMGPENAAWASYYGAFVKESYVTSFSYNDYDPSYVSMQIDTVLAGSNYLVAKTSDQFGDYEILFAEDVEDDEEQEPSGLVKDLQYFDAFGSIVSNLIEPGQRSYAYALALRQIMGNNLTIWRCVVTANLGDVMNTPDFQGVIEAAAESTLGVTNIGKAASLDAFNNLGGRHGMRFIADFPQYGRRNVAGRRMWLTMAALVTLTLNNNYKNGNEARPPMGLSYGKILCDALSEDFTGPQRKMLAETFKLNPAIDENGFYLWEETTSQQADSALSDTHVILSYCWMKYMIYESMRPFVAEYNDTPTINDGVRVLKGLNKTFISRNYIEEGKPNADKNVLGDKVMRFDFPVRFKGVGRFVDVYVTAYPQTQSLEISLSEEA
jgi:hypothetical protein